MQQNQDAIFKPQTTRLSSSNPLSRTKKPTFQIKQQQTTIPPNQLETQPTTFSLQPTNLKWSDDHESLEHPGAEAGQEPVPVGELPGLRVLERRLEHGVRPHPERVLERQVRRERRQALPESPDALGLGDGGAAVGDPLVGTGLVKLEPGLDDVDRLEAARLHRAPERARDRLHVGRDRALAVGIGGGSRLARHGGCPARSIG